MTDTIEIKSTSRQPRLDARPLEKRIGLIILATDHTTEVDFARMVASERIGVYVSRIPYANPVTPENLMKMQPSLTQGANLILPDEPLDVVMYSCTSASVVIGDDRIGEAVRAAKPGVAVVTPTTAAVKGLKALGARRISVLTPYTVETSRPMAAYFARLGFQIDRFTCLGLTDDREMARIAPDEIVAAACEAMAPGSDALFISCTAVRAAQVAARIEDAIGKPVVTSNLATAWACLRLCGEAASRPDLGTLMTRPYPEADRMSPQSASVTIDDIRAAAARIAGRALKTPMVESAALSELAGVPVFLKLEHHQTTGSFKLRGATNAVLSLTEEDRARGVVAASTGNHGRALAYAAKAEGAVATICMSRLVPENKVAEIRRLGAEVRIVGRSQDEAQDEVDRLVVDKGMAMVPPFDHPAVVAGQGTLGLEMMEQLPETATVLVPLSGGGLAAGVAAAVKALKSNTRVIGLTMERGAAMKASLDAGGPVQVEELPSLADSLGGGIGLGNRITFAMCRDLLDEVVLLSEEEIAASMRHAYAVEREIVEGAGAVGIAALLSGRIRVEGPVAVILSGRNVDMDMHRRVINGAASLGVEDAA